MKALVVASFFFLAFPSHASFTIYGFGDIGIWSYDDKPNKLTKVNKYGGGVGLEYNFLSFLSLAAEFDYITGVTSDPIPHSLIGQKAPESYGGFNERGINFVNVNYWELWIRPKLLIPTPIVQPYLALLFSPLNYGGMKGYSSFGMGFGATLGLQASISSILLFVESGATVRTRKGKAEGPPWGMFDFAIPVRFGVGYTF